MEYLVQTEQRIIEAATEVFREKGRDGARMQEIADRAGINKALLHYYFRSKDQLYRRVFQRELKKILLEFLQSLSPEEDFRQFLQNFLHQYIQRIASRPDVVRFVLWEISRGGEGVGETFRELLTEAGFSEIPFLPRIRQAIARKEIRPVDPLHFSLSLLGMAVYPFLAEPLLKQVFQDLDVQSPTFLQMREQEIFELVWKGIQPEE